MAAELAGLNCDRAGKPRPSQLDLTSAICSPQGAWGGRSVSERSTEAFWACKRGGQLSQRVWMLALQKQASFRATDELR